MALTTPLVSVVVCTYNRSACLRDALRSLSAQIVDPGEAFEVIVVDNNSSDDTREVVARAQPSFPCRLRYLFERRQGLSYARNAGVMAACGELLAFTDDDVEVDRRWLASLLEAFERFDADCVYGKILPRWLGPKPPWLGPQLACNLALLDHGEQPFVVSSEAHRFFGANVAVRKAALAAVGMFNEQLGRRGEGLGSGEDTDLFFRLRAQGRRIVYQPEAKVTHTVPVERLTRGYFRRWHLADGRTWAEALSVNGGRSVCGIPLWTVREFLAATGRFAGSLCVGDPQARIADEVRVFYYLGFCGERMRMWWRSATHGRC